MTLNNINGKRLFQEAVARLFEVQKVFIECRVSVGKFEIRWGVSIYNLLMQV